MSTPQAHRRITDAVWSSDLPPFQRLVMLAYLKYAHGANGTDSVWLTQAQLISVTGVPERTVRRVVRDLERLGWLVPVTPARQHYSARYRLTDPSGPAVDNASQTGHSGRPGISQTGQIRHPDRPNLHPRPATVAPESLPQSLSESFPPALTEPQGSPSVTAEPGGKEPDRNDISARRALSTLVAERRLPFTVDQLLELSYVLGRGNPWAGYLHHIKPATEHTFDGARDPTAVLRKRLLMP